MCRLTIVRARHVPLVIGKTFLTSNISDNQTRTRVYPTSGVNYRSCRLMTRNFLFAEMNKLQGRSLQC
jgi:hypothetical protein